MILPWLIGDIYFLFLWLIHAGNTKHPAPALDLLMDTNFSQLGSQSMEMVVTTVDVGVAAAVVAVVVETL
jgi:hypothetical protein